VASIAVDPANGRTLYVATTIGVRGVSGNSGGAVVDPNAPPVGVYKSTDGGRSFSLVYDDSNGAFGATHIELDSNGDVYASANGEGIYRSHDGGGTWELVFQTKDQSGNGRTEFALTKKDGHTRIWVADGGDQYFPADGVPNSTPTGSSWLSTSGVYRGDGIDTKTAAQLAGTGGNPGYVSFSTDNRRDPGYLTYDYCWAQCSYDNFVVTPAGKPDMVYVGGAYNYDFPARNNGRTVLLSTDAGKSWWDQTKDIPTKDGIQNGIHPDQHALVVNPNNPLQFFEGSDGGVVRTSGELANGTADCDNRNLDPVGASYAACKNALARIPTRIDSLNAGLSTLQFGAISVDPTNSKNIQGGTQDNGTFEGLVGAPNWGQTMYGDGGVSAFDISNTKFRMNEFYQQYTDVNFQGGDPTAWVVVSAPFFASGENVAFYKPQINDPAVSGTLFVGLDHVWRSKDFGGNQADLEANCPEFSTFGDQPGCGDFVPLGDPSGQGGTTTQGSLTDAGAYGADKSGGYVVRIARTPSDHNTMWVATRRGRVFITKNADYPNAGAVTFKRLDAGSSVAPGSVATPRRFVSGVVVDPKNPNHAFVSYGGYNSAAAPDGLTPAVPGHVFDVLYDPLTGKAKWTSLDRGTGPLGDLPVTDLARDDKTGRLYAATDFNVLVQKGTSGRWQLAAGGMPMVEVSGLTIDQKARVLYASTHGRAIWSLQLQNDGNNDGNGNNGNGNGNNGNK
jgi:hypothetical protein